MKLETIILLVLLYFSQINAYIDRSSSNIREYQIQRSDLYRHGERLKEFRFQRVHGKFEDERRLYLQETFQHSDFEGSVDRNNNIIRRQQISQQRTHRMADRRISEGTAVKFSQTNNFCTESLDRRSQRFSEVICSKRKSDDVSRRINQIETISRRFPENKNLYNSERSTELGRKRELQMADLSSMQRRMLKSRIDRTDRTRYLSASIRNRNVNHANNNIEGLIDNAANTRIHNEDRYRINNQLSSENRNTFTANYSNLRRLKANRKEFDAKSIQRRISNFRVQNKKLFSTSDNIAHGFLQREDRNSFNLRQISERRNNFVRDIRTTPIQTNRISTISSYPINGGCSLGNHNAINSRQQRQGRNIRDIYFDSHRQINSRLSDNKRFQILGRKDRGSLKFNSKRFSNLVRLNEDWENNIRNLIVTEDRKSIDVERSNKPRQERNENAIESKSLQSGISETPNRHLVYRRNSHYENRNARRSDPRLNQYKTELGTNRNERTTFQLTNRRILQNRSNNNLQVSDEQRERNVRQTEFKRNQRLSADIEIRRRYNLIQRRISETNRFSISHRIKRTSLTNRNKEQTPFQFTSNRERSIHENMRVSQKQFNRDNRRQRFVSTLDYNNVGNRIESRGANSEKREIAKPAAETRLYSIQRFRRPSQDRFSRNQQRTQIVDNRNTQRESPRGLKLHQTLKRVSNIEFRQKSKPNEENRDNRIYLGKTTIKITRDRSHRSVPSTIQIRHENTQTKTVQSITSADRAVFRRQTAYLSPNEFQRNYGKDTQSRSGNTIMNNESTFERRSSRDIQIENRKSYILMDNINKKSGYEDSPAWLGIAKLLFLSISVAQILSASNPKFFTINKIMTAFTYHKEKIF